MKEGNVMTKLRMVHGNRSPTLVLAFCQIIGQLDLSRCRIGVMTNFVNAVTHKRTTFVE